MRISPAPGGFLLISQSDVREFIRVDFPDAGLQDVGKQLALSPSCCWLHRGGACRGSITAGAARYGASSRGRSASAELLDDEEDADAQLLRGRGPAPRSSASVTASSGQKTWES